MNLYNFRYKTWMTFFCFGFLINAAAFAQQTPIPDFDSATPEHLTEAPVSIRYEPDSDVFTADQLSPRISEEFQGALFVCNPFCEVVSQKIGEEWKPELEKIKIISPKIKVMAVEDPLYKILFPDNALEVQKIAAARKESRASRRKGQSKIEKKLAQKEADEKENPSPKSAFENGFRYYLGSRYSLISQTTDNVGVQTDFKPKGGMFNAHLGLGYYRGKYLKLWKWWIRPEVGYEMDLFGTSAKLANESQLSLSRSKMFLNIWFKQKSFSWAPHFAMNKYQYKVSENNLTAFSYDEDVKYVGLAFKYKRYRFDLDYGVGYAINEKQPFRDKLTKAEQYSVEGMYCAAQVTLFDLDMVPCYGAQYMMTSNKATFKPNIDPSGSVALSRQDIVLFANFYFGEDFLR